MSQAKLILDEVFSKVEALRLAHPLEIHTCVQEIPTLHTLLRAPDKEFPKVLVTFAKEEVPAPNQLIGNTHRFILPFIIAICTNKNNLAEVAVIEETLRVIRNKIEETRRWTAGQYPLQTPIKGIYRHHSEPQRETSKLISFRSIEFDILYQYEAGAQL